MTRLASIVGVATVATLVLLSGCESAVKTDYTAKLDGTWTVSGLTGTIPNPQLAQDPDALPATIPVPTDVTVVIKDGEGLNTGTFSLTVTQTIPGAPTPVDTIGSGSVKAESSTVLKVTLEEIMGDISLPR